MKNINRVWFLLSSRQKLFAGFLILGILLNATLEAFSIGLVLPLIDLINNIDNVQNYPIMMSFATFFGLTNNRDILTCFFYLFSLLFITKTGFFIFLGYYRQKFVADVMNKLTGRLFNFYLKNSWDFHLNKNSSELQNNIVVQVGAICTGLISSLLMFATEILVTIAIIILLLATDPITTLIVFVIVTITGIVFFSSIKGKLEAYGAIAQNFMEKMIKSVNEAFGGVKEIKVLGREDYYDKKFQKNVIKYTQSWVYPAFIHLLQRSMIEIVFIGSIVTISLYILIVGGETSYLLGILSLFAAAAFRLMPSVSRITLSISTIKYYTPILSTIYDDIKKSVSNDNKEGEENLIKINTVIFKKSIQLENVSFYYQGTDRKVIDNISIEIPKGSSVGFIGASGAGKTTLIDIILGLLKPSSGRTMVDGEDIHNNLSLWQKHIGYIPQNIFLSDDTIRNNIAFGLDISQINDNKIWEAIENAQLGKVVKNLPKGLDTIIGESGLKISGGQRQRIGIARALYNDPDILVLDEATSSLDSETEKEISAAINKLSIEKTLLVIAHRLSTLENCDLQFHLKNGKIEKIINNEKKKHN